LTEKFYYVDDEKIPLKPSTAFMAIQFSPEANEAARIAVAEKTDVIESLEAGEELEPFGIILLPTTQEATEEALTLSAGEVAAEPDVDRTLPVFQMPDGEPDEVMILIPQFRVQFKSGVSEEDIDKLNNEHGVEVVVKNDLGPNSYLLRLTLQASQDALVIANLYHESDLTEYAEPDFVFKVRRLSAVNDPHYSNQWALGKMNVPQAWNVSKGSLTIKIAIVDEGVQTSHPDLAAKIVTPYDAVDDDNNQEPNQWDGHGTACAGIAAAVTNNAKGVAGVARECKIIPIRIAYSSRPNANWTTNTTWIARGIRKAVDLGADVISNSWGGGLSSTTVRNAFKYAVTNGRDGKGCVVISATANADRRNISYPAKYPESMACGASNEWDERKSKNSQDGENWWGSNYGPELDFLAPGVHIYTTDITGMGGYGLGDYVPNFNGTSSATPNAAGVAALILSVNPNLNYGEVKDILRLTAKDLGPTGWDEQHGSGRLDAQKALLRAQNQIEKEVIYRYAVKFVCGIAKGEVLAPGDYWTAINVHNPTSNPVKFRKKIAIALPGERPGPVTEFFDARLGPDQALEIDRKDIFRHAEKEGFLKGFVIIESEIELDVVAVYTATGGDERVETMFLERVFPRRPDVGKPDLIPVPDEKGFFCKREDSMLIVTVKNQGTRVADSSTTKVDFFKYGVVTKQTPSLAPSQSVDLSFKIPTGCFDSDCEFQITVDADNNVVESDEGNNTASGTCIG
jgi:subtilisin family serine protease